jgi:hypothetical protein
VGLNWVSFDDLFCCLAPLHAGTILDYWPAGCFMRFGSFFLVATVNLGQIRQMVQRTVFERDSSRGSVPYALQSAYLIVTPLQS